MNHVAKKLSILTKAQLALLSSKGKKIVRSLVLIILALVFALLTIMVFNFAGFLWLDQKLGPITAGLIVGAVDLGLCALLLMLALKDQEPSSEEMLAKEVSEMTLSSLEEDLDSMRADLHEFKSDLRRIMSIVHWVTQGLSAPLSLLTKFVGNLDIFQTTGTSRSRAESSE